MSDEALVRRTKLVEWAYEHAINQWPHAIQRCLHSSHMNNEQRFKFTVFVLGNGLAPKWKVDWLFKMHGVYDKQAYRQIDWVVANYTKYSYWDITLGRSNRS